MSYANSVQQAEASESLNSSAPNIFADINYIAHFSHFTT